MATQKKGRKIGNKKKVPSQKRYTMEQRWLRNKRKKVAKHEREVARKRNKILSAEVRKKNHVEVSV